MKKELRPLSEMKIGEKAVVKKQHTKGSLKRRLLDIGLIEGTMIECILESPLHDPKAYLIRGAVIAIRDCDAKNIMIESKL